MAMTQVVHREPREEIEILLPIGVPDVAPLPFDRCKREPVVGVHDMLLGQFDDFRSLQCLTLKTRSPQSNRLGSDSLLNIVSHENDPILLSFLP